MSAARERARAIGGFVAAWLAFPALPWARSNNRDLWVRDAIDRVFSGYPALVNDVNHIWRAFENIAIRTCFEGLWIGTIVWTLGALVRMSARARVRSGLADFLDPVRAFVREQPRAARGIMALPGVWWALSMWLAFHHYRWHIPIALGVLSALSGAVMGWWSTVSARALLTPTMVDASLSRFEITPEEIVFDAVAVTAETKGAVAALAALTVGVIALLGSRPIEALYHGRMPFEIMLGYVLVAAASAVVFRMASRVAVGLDGVHVRGTSRARFYAYREIDEARVVGGDLELVRRGRVVVRLQLHGEDAARRGAVLARISEHVARVKEGRGATAARLVASSTKETLARVAHGGADYRMATLTREQLWALVEGPEIEASARRAAAEALAKASGADERARLRVAAEMCAEPSVRIALAEIAREEPEPADAMRRAAT